MPSRRPLALSGDADGPARQHRLRDHNLALVLRLIATAQEPPSRAQIAATTGLTRATAGALVERLVSAGLVGEEAVTRTLRSGRPATGLRLAAHAVAAVGLEVNVDYIAITQLDLAGAVIAQEVHAGDQRGRPPADVLREAGSIAAAAVRSARRLGTRTAGVAVALPGLLREGRVPFAPNLGWTDVDARRVLRLNRTIGALDIAVDNEANYAAMSQVSEAHRNFLHLSGEIGIGAAIVRDGVLQAGARGWAGELGHVSYRPDGPRCRCGSDGCLEVYAGQEAISRAAGLPAPGGTLLGGATSALASAAARGEGSVLAALEQAGTALGTVVAGALNLLDVPTVCLGGAYEALAPWLLPPVERELRTRVLWGRLDAPTVTLATHGPYAATVGAARSVIQTVLSAPERWLTDQ